MTQRNIDIMDRIIDEVAAGKKIADALKEVYTKRNVVIPNYEEMLDISVLKMGMTNRVTNALMRKRLRTIGEVVEFTKKNSLKEIGGFGSTSGLTLLETILNIAWDRMNEDERFQFLVDVVERNEEYLRAELM